MNNLLKLRKWLTPSETAAYLSQKFGQTVTEADVLEFGVNRRLQLSVFLPRTCWAYMGEIVSAGKQSFFGGPGDIGVFAAFNPMSLRLKGLIRPIDESRPRTRIDFTTERGVNVLMHNGEDVFSCDVKDRVLLDCGWYELPMIGDERREVENRVVQLRTGTASNEVGYDGIFLHSGGLVYKLLNEDESDWAVHLFEDAVLAVQVLELQKMIHKVLESDTTDPSLIADPKRVVLPHEEALLMLDSWAALLVERTAEKNSIAWRILFERLLGDQKYGLIARDEQSDPIHRPRFSLTTCWLKSHEIRNVLTARGYVVSFENTDIPEQHKSQSNSDSRGVADNVQSQVGHLSASSLTWDIKELKRLPGYRGLLFDFLKEKKAEGHDFPNARGFLDWLKPQAGNGGKVHEVLDEEFKFYDSKGNIEAVRMESVRKAIERMTTK